MASSPKNDALNNAMALIEKQFGKGSIMKMGAANRTPVEMIPTGSIAVDLALGGGVPRGRIIEIYGPESSGKTTLTLCIAAEAQKMGGQVAFIDAEHALDPEYAQKIGVDIDNLLLSQPDSGEQALEIVETLVRSGAVDVIVVDSVAALTPRAEIDGEMGDSHMGLQARLMSQALRKLTSIVSKTKTTVIFINQIRMKIGVMFGNPETTTGGNALKFYASMRVEIRKGDKIEEGTGDNKQVIGNKVRIKVVKNKVYPPFKNAEFNLMYNKGIDREADLVEAGLSKDVITKSGNTLLFGKDKLGVGKEQAREALMKDKKMAAEVEKKLRATIGSTPTPAAPEKKAK